MQEFLATSPLILPLCLIALIAVVIVIERSWILRMGVLAPRTRIMFLLDTITHSDAYQVLSQSNDNNPLQRLLLAALANESGGMQTMRNAIRFEGELLAHELQRFLGLLGTIAMIAPLLGLLGTVLGLIDAFEALLQGDVSRTVSPQLSSGIAEALTTTAFGLIIAIPAVFFHRLLQRKVFSLIIALERQTLQMLRDNYPALLRNL